MSWLHSQKSNFVFTVPILLEGTVSVCLCLCACVCICIWRGTVHVFVPKCHGTDLSVRCIRPYDEYRQFTPNPEGVACGNTMLFDYRQCQQKNSECRELCAWKQSPLDSDVLILNASLTWTDKSFVLVYPTSHSAQILIFPYLQCYLSESKLLFIM